jgi:F-type H+-transporting ATPase subunit epsilon
MLNLEIVTPERKVFDEVVDAVTIPTTNGEIGVLPNHAPLISTLKPGVLTISNRGASERLAIAGGFVEVSANKVSILADTAERADEVNVESARAERESAERVWGLGAEPKMPLNWKESDSKRRRRVYNLFPLNRFLG